MTETSSGETTLLVMFDGTAPPHGGWPIVMTNGLPSSADLARWQPMLWVLQNGWDNTVAADLAAEAAPEILPAVADSG